MKKRKMIRWMCQFINSKGVICDKAAVARLHFGVDHPFDFVDVCEVHKKEYRYYTWYQSLSDWNELT